MIWCGHNTLASDLDNSFVCLIMAFPEFRSKGQRTGSSGTLAWVLSSKYLANFHIEMLCWQFNIGLQLIKRNRERERKRQREKDADGQTWQLKWWMSFLIVNQCESFCYLATVTCYFLCSGFILYSNSFIFTINKCYNNACN